MYFLPKQRCLYIHLLHVLFIFHELNVNKVFGWTSFILTTLKLVEWLACIVGHCTLFCKINYQSYISYQNIAHKRVYEQSVAINSLHKAKN